MCQSRRILLLSNTDDLGRFIQLSLEVIAGWQVFIGKISSESLAVAEALQPNVIILDTALPDLEGLAMLPTLKANPATQNIPLVLLTARMRRGDRNWYERLGILVAIAKPFNPIDLAQQIANKLNWDKV